MSQDPAAKPAADRLKKLRALLAAEGLTGFIVPHADEFQSEYLPPAAERLAWLTGFTGSAGLAIVLRDEAALFVDGRYTLQASQQADPASFAFEHLIESPPAKWLAAHAKPGDRIGYDPWLLTVSEAKRFAEAAKGAGAELVAMAENPLDRLWDDRPAAPLGAVALHPASLAGEESAKKIVRIGKAVAEKKAGAAILGQADSIAWLFNIRGADVAHNPVALARAIVPAEGRPHLFIDGRKLSNAARAALADLAEIGEPADMASAVGRLAAAKTAFLLDPATTPQAVAELIKAGGGTIVEGADPTALPKARKNATELAGARAAHVRDGAAMVRFLAWFDRTAPDGCLDEIAAAEKLASLRADTARRDGSELVDLSFDTISGAGPNGAIIHYRVTPETNRRIESGSLYLVDSGAQYRDGTTDITRTVPVGTPTAEMRDRYTRVLKGNLAIGMARFPAGTSGAQIDALARVALWRAGLDYDHGTGHGVGSFLSVHEGPARISKLGHVALEPGMILSNEPGYYKPGGYGIRIETLVIVTPPAPVPGGDREMLGFETLTLCPVDRRLIDVGLLTAEERAWLDAYHAGLPAKLDRLLDGEERAWLRAATAAL